jgi:hypothetical protein
MKHINWMNGVKEYLYSRLFGFCHLPSIIAILVIAIPMFCGHQTGKEMGAKRTITTEEASWTESKSPWQTEFRKNFKVIE